MSPNQGRRGTRGKGKSGGTPARPSGPAAARRLGLIIFGAAFVILFAVVAITEGVGDPSVPSGDIAVVEDAPGDTGTVTEADFKRALEQVAAQAGEKETPKPGDPKYEELKEAALKAKFEAIWLQGLADELGIEVSDKEIAKELQKVKKESFKSEAEYQKFLKEAHYTQTDVNERLKVQKLGNKVQERLKENVPAPSDSEVEDYYEAAKATQFTQKPSRDVRLIVNKSRERAEEAQDALTKDDTAKNWTKIAKQYSEDPTTKENGGLQKAVQEGGVEEPLSAAVFKAPEGQLEGPIKTPRGWTVYQVVDSTSETTQELKDVAEQIEGTLAQRAEQEYFGAYVASYSQTWTSRTFCASGYVSQSCANFESNGHPSTAPPACYEADPKGGLPEACPASVFQLIPAQPGSVTPLEPQGKPLAQRPRPAGEESEAAASPAGLPPEGAVPPPAEAPSE